MSYIFRREDNGELVEVSFEVMIEQDRAGYILLKGVPAKRCVHLEIERDGRPVRCPPPPWLDRPIISDSLGFAEQQLAEFEADRVKHGFSGIEFKPDPDVPQFYQVHARRGAELERYIRHRKFVNANGIGGVLLSAEDLRAAEERAREKYGGDTVS